MRSNILLRISTILLIIFSNAFNSFAESDPLIIEITIKNDVTCHGYCDGAIDITVTGGSVIEDYKYEWSTIDGSGLNKDVADQVGLCAGTYTITVTDDNLNMVTESVIINSPSRLTPEIDTIRNLICFGAGDGYAVLKPVGGNGSYSYLWSSGETTDSIGGLQGDIYYVTVTDWKGCAADTSIEVDEPPQVSVDLTEYHVTCNGENNGRIETNILGINTYKWNTGATTATISNLSPALYTVTITSAEGCVSIASAVIQEPEIMLIDFIVSTSISCAGDNDGIIDLFVSGGNTELSYTYNWSTDDGAGQVANIEDQTGLTKGKYYVTVNDWKGCSTIDSTSIAEPEPIILEITDSTNIACYGGTDGAINITIAGGTINEDYTYYWATMDGSGLTVDFEDQEGLTKGIYYVTVNDLNGCSESDTIELTQPEKLDFEITSLADVTCFGENNGEIHISVTGGTVSEDYLYLWETTNGSGLVEGIADQLSLGGGNYILIVKDDNLCKFDTTIVIQEPNDIIILSDTAYDASSEIQTDGSIRISADGGNGNLKYTLIPSAISNYTGVFENLNAGEYSVQVTDENGCGPVTVTKVIGYPTSNNISKFDHNFIISPNPTNGKFCIKSELFDKDVFNVEIFTIKGEIIYNTKIIWNGIIKKEIDLSGYKNGIYFLRISNDKIKFTEKILLF